MSNQLQRQHQNNPNTGSSQHQQIIEEDCEVSNDQDHQDQLINSVNPPYRHQIGNQFQQQLQNKHMLQTNGVKPSINKNQPKQSQQLQRDNMMQRNQRAATGGSIAKQHSQYLQSQQPISGGGFYANHRLASNGIINNQPQRNNTPCMVYSNQNGLQQQPIHQPHNSQQFPLSMNYTNNNQISLRNDNISMHMSNVSQSQSAQSKKVMPRDLLMHNNGDNIGGQFSQTQGAVDIQQLIIQQQQQQQKQLGPQGLQQNILSDQNHIPTTNIQAQKTSIGNYLQQMHIPKAQLQIGLSKQINSKSNAGQLGSNRGISTPTIQSSLSVQSSTVNTVKEMVNNCGKGKGLLGSGRKVDSALSSRRKINNRQDTVQKNEPHNQTRPMTGVTSGINSRPSALQTPHNQSNKHISQRQEQISQAVQSKSKQPNQRGHQQLQKHSQMKKQQQALSTYQQQQQQFQMRYQQVQQQQLVDQMHSNINFDSSSKLNIPEQRSMIIDRHPQPLQDSISGALMGSDKNSYNVQRQTKQVNLQNNKSSIMSPQLLSSGYSFGISTNNSNPASQQQQYQNQRNGDSSKHLQINMPTQSQQQTATNNLMVMPDSKIQSQNGIGYGSQSINSKGSKVQYQGTRSGFTSLNLNSTVAQNQTTGGVVNSNIQNQIPDTTYSDFLNRNNDKSNNYCFECAQEMPQWISVNNGLYICLMCAGVHRGFGVQISFVRSLEMDNISDVQKRMLQYGGNKKFTQFLKIYGLQNEPVETRYFTKACQLYRDSLKMMAEQDKPIAFTQDILATLQLEDGKQSIYGVRPSYIFNDQGYGNNPSSSKVFQRDTYNNTSAGNMSMQRGSRRVTHSIQKNNNARFSAKSQGLGIKATRTARRPNEQSDYSDFALQLNRDVQSTNQSGPNDRFSNLIENTKEGMNYVSEKLSSFQDYLVQQLRMADCCNNVTMVDESRQNLQGYSLQQRQYNQ